MPDASYEVTRLLDRPLGADLRALLQWLTELNSSGDARGRVAGHFAEALAEGDSLTARLTVCGIPAVEREAICNLREPLALGYVVSAFRGSSVWNDIEERERVLPSALAALVVRSLLSEGTSQ